MLSLECHFIHFLGSTDLRSVVVATERFAIKLVDRCQKCMHHTMHITQHITLSSLLKTKNYPTKLTQVMQEGTTQHFTFNCVYVKRSCELPSLFIDMLRQYCNNFCAYLCITYHYFTSTCPHGVHNTRSVTVHTITRLLTNRRSPPSYTLVTNLPLYYSLPAILEN